MTISSFKLDPQNQLTIRLDKMPVEGKTADNVIVLIGNSGTKYKPKSIAWAGEAMDSTVVIDAPYEQGYITVQILKANVTVKSEDPYIPPARPLKAPTGITTSALSAKPGETILMTGQNMNSIDKWFLGDSAGIDPSGITATALSFKVPKLGAGPQDLKAGPQDIKYEASAVNVKKTSTQKILRVNP